MGSDEIEMEQSATDLKYLWILKKIVSRFLVILSNVYYFAKENSGDFKTTFVSIENTLVSDVGPAYEKLKDFAEQIIVFLDDKLDKYAPSQAKKLVTEFESLINKTKPFVKILLTTTRTLIIPLINISIFLLQTTKYFILSIITTKTTKDTIPQKDSDVANHALDKAKSLVGGIPLVGNVAESLVSNPTDVANEIVNTTNSLVNKNPILGVVKSAAQNSLGTTSSQKGLDLANQAQGPTKSPFGGIPLMGDVAKSIMTNPADLANQIVNTTNSVVNKNPVLEAINSAAKSSLETAKSLGPDTILQKGPDLVNQAQDMTKTLAGGIPIVGNVAESLATNPTDLANQILNTTNSLVNENPILEAINSAAENIGKNPQSTGIKAALQSAYMAMNLAGIPVIAQVWYEIVNEYPLVGEVSEFILPVVESACKLYNKVVTYMNGKGYKISGYLPLVPIDEIKAAYKLVKTSRDALSGVADILGMDNNKGLSTVGNILGMNK